MKSGRGASLLNIYVITGQQKSICSRQHPRQNAGARFLIHTLSEYPFSNAQT